MKKIRVLLVEDDAPLRHLLRTTLERTGRFSIVGEAAEGAAGVTLAATTSPDLILLDLAMPVVGGVEALPSIRKVCPAAKVVALSMLQREQWEKRVLDAGAVAFLDKALPSQELIERLLRIMGDSGGAVQTRGPPGPLRVDWIGDPWRVRRSGARFSFRLRSPTGLVGDGRWEPYRASTGRSGPDPR